METCGQVYQVVNENGGRIQWNDTKRAIVAFGVATGMCYLHERGIIHRDLKTENIMLDEDLFPRICDFGFAKIVGADEQLQQLINQSMDIGTPVYMALELFSDIGNGRYSPAVDVFSYAMVLYELVTLTVPWERVKGSEKCTRFNIVGYLEKGLRPTIPEYVPAAYKQLIEACWAQNPSQRPTFREIVEQTRGLSLCFDSSDENAVIDYQEKMLKSLNECKAERK
jgi:serine/threonine protein kinase